MKKQLLIQFGVILSLAAVFVVSLLMINHTWGQPDRDEHNGPGLSKKPQPIIIWHHGSRTSSPEALETALSSGLITHVSIGTGHRKDAPYKKKKPDFHRLVETIKRYDAKVIWMCSLWPSWANDGISFETLFDSEYYISELQILREEAKEIGADFTAIYLEAHGTSPLRPYLSRPGKLDRQQLKSLVATIKKVVEKTGKADFVIPVGWLNQEHPYTILAGLGENKISECTFWDNSKRFRIITYPYDIFGAYINTTKENKGNSKLPYFLPGEIFERSELWSHKKGVFLYPREGNSMAVAKKLVEYAKTLPHNADRTSKK